MNTITPQKTAAYNFLTAHAYGSLATLSQDGNPRVRTVYYACDESLSIYFLTLENTRKVADIRANPAAAFVVTDADKNSTMQLEGMFEEITDTTTFGPILSNLTARLFPNHALSAPITHMDSAKPVCFKLVPTWIRYGDFLQGSSSEEVFTIVD